MAQQLELAKETEEAINSRRRSQFSISFRFHSQRGGRQILVAATPSSACASQGREVPCVACWGGWPSRQPTWALAAQSISAVPGARRA